MNSRDRGVVVPSLVLLMLLAGCQGPLQSGGTERGNPEWDRVRARVLNQLAEKQIEAHQYIDATQSLVESLALHGEQPDAYAKLGRAHLEMGKAKTADMVLQAAAREGVDSAELTYLRGVILEQADDYPGALAEFELARSMDPSQVDYFVANIECLVMLGRPQEAISLLDQHALAFDEDATIATLAGYLASSMGDDDEAVRRLRRAHLATKSSRPVAEELAFLLVKQRRFVEALALLQPMIEAGGENGMMRTIAAESHLAIGNPTAARQVIATYAEQNPDDVATQLLFGYASLASSDLGSSWLALERAERRARGSRNVKLFHASVVRNQGDLFSAETILRDLLQQYPDFIEAHCLLAEVYRDQADYESARRHFKRAQSIDRTCGWAGAGLRQLNQMTTMPTGGYRHSGNG